jgi:hypothetical protein
MIFFFRKKYKGSFKSLDRFGEKAHNWTNICSPTEKTFDLISIPIVDIVTEAFPDERKWHTSKSYRF